MREILGATVLLPITTSLVIFVVLISSYYYWPNRIIVINKVLEGKEKKHQRLPDLLQNAFTYTCERDSLLLYEVNKDFHCVSYDLN